MEARNNAAASSSSSAAANRAEAERLIGISEKLLQGHDLSGCRDFAVLAQETESLLDGPDQILAVAEVLLAANKRVNNQRDWYAVLQVDRRSDNIDLIKKQYRRLALLLHPDKNRFAFADSAFQIVSDAWNVLSDPVRKARYDRDLGFFSKVDLVKNAPPPPPAASRGLQQRKLPVRRSFGKKKAATEETSVQNEEQSFWTVCPYCFRLFEYLKVYEGCCLRCQNCKRSFHAASIPSLPPLVPGKEAYYCCWGVFPLGFVVADSNGKNTSASAAADGFPNWMPPIFPNSQPGSTATATGEL